MANIEQRHPVPGGGLATVRPRRLSAMAIFALVGGVVINTMIGCAPDVPEIVRTDRPSVLLITIDTIRADHCSTYGYNRQTTPAMTRAAEAGVLFHNAYAPIATTAPSHASIFTSMYPRSHGVMKNGLTLRPKFRTLAEEMRAAGYQTGAVVSSFPVAAKFGLDQGMDYYNDAFEADGRKPRERKWEGMTVDTYFDRDARITSQVAETWLRTARDPARPFFLWVHYYDPHTPYRPRDSHRGLFLGDKSERPDKKSLQWKVAMYDAEIRETDDAIDRLLAVVDAENLTQSTVVIMTGDHGEGLMQHGHMTHGIHLYEEAVRVPLIIRWPGGIPAGISVQQPAQLIDVMPTVLEIAGVDSDNLDLNGQSLLGAMRGQEVLDPDRDVFLERRMFKNRQIGRVVVNGTKLGLRSGSWKYIEAIEESARELYNLDSDPHEASNLTDQYPHVVERLSKKLEDWVRVTPSIRIGSDSNLSDQDLEMLQAMGYVQ